jgi:hypothetical protein
MKYLMSELKTYKDFYGVIGCLILVLSVVSFICLIAGTNPFIATGGVLVIFLTMCLVPVIASCLSAIKGTNNGNLR